MGIQRDQAEKLIVRKRLLYGRPIRTEAERWRTNNPFRSRYRSQAEADYAAKLEVQKRAGEIVHWEYETVTLQIGRTEAGRKWTYTPDFFVIKNIWYEKLPEIEFHEVKRPHRFREKGLMKFRAAKALYPWFNWVLVEK